MFEIVMPFLSGGMPLVFGSDVSSGPPGRSSGRTRRRRKPPFGFEGRAGKNVKFISENYLFSDEGFGILSAGPRFFGERLSADVGLALPFAPNMDGFFVFPPVNFVWNW